MPPLLTDFTQMIDLAVGYPEFNIVNLNMLHIFLHALVKTLDLDSSRVEIYGSQFETMESLLNTLPEKANINVTEYEVENEDGAERVLVIQNSGEEIQTKTQKNSFPAKVTRDIERIDKSVLNTLTKISRLASNIQTNSNVISDIRDKIDEMEHVLVDNFKLPERYQRGFKTKPLDTADKKFTTDQQIYNDIEILREQVANLFDCIKQFGKILQDEELMQSDVMYAMEAQVNIPESFIPPIRPQEFQFVESKITSKSEAKEANIQKREDRKLKAIETKFTVMERQNDINEKRFTEIAQQLIEIVENLPSEETKNDFVDMKINIKEINEILEKIEKQAESLESEKNRILNVLELLRQKNESLDSVKVDKEEVEQQLNEKVDYEMLHKRVPFDVFETTKRELLFGIENVMTRVAEKAKNYENLMKDLETRLEKKLEKDEISNFKRSLNTKLKFQQAEINTIKQQQEAEAAGSTKKFIKDVSCLSCSQDVVMRNKETALVPKLQKSVLNTVKLGKILPGLTNEKSDSQDICTRYCGGAHTIISAEDRTQMKLISENRSTIIESCPKYTVLLRGKDGTLYKGDPSLCIAMHPTCDTKIVN